MKITIDIPIDLYERMENALSLKTMREALKDPIVMVGWHVVSARSAQHGVQRTATPVKAKVTCSNGHARVVEGKEWSSACPECGIETYEYDSRFGGE